MEAVVISLASSRKASRISNSIQKTEKVCPLVDNHSNSSYCNRLSFDTFETEGREPVRIVREGCGDTESGVCSFKETVPSPPLLVAAAPAYLWLLCYSSTEPTPPPQHTHPSRRGHAGQHASSPTLNASVDMSPMHARPGGVRKPTVCSPGQ